MDNTKHEAEQIEQLQKEKKSRRNMIISAAVLVVALIAVLAVYLIKVLPGMTEQPELYITEVVTSNNLSYVDEVLGSPDWIEIYNASSFDVSLEGYGISDIAVLPYRYMFGDVTIGAGEYLVVFATQERGTDDVCLGFSLAKEGETITLTNDEGVILQMLDVPEMMTDKSWGLTSDGQYMYMAAPSAGAQNGGVVSDTLDSFEMAAGGESVIVVSEVMPSVSALNEGAAGQYAWVELYNTAGEAVNLQNFYLSDNVDNIKKWRLPDMQLGSHEFVLVYISGKDLYENELHTSFSLSGKETTLYLSDGNLGVTNEVSWDGGISRHVSVGTEQGVVKYFGVPTPGGQNSAIAFDSFEKTQIMSGLKVNEILLDNTYSMLDEDGDSSAWVEFYNSSGSTIALGNYYLSDSESSPYKWRFPNSLIAPGEYLVVYLSGKDRAGDELHTGFRIGEDETVLVMTDRENMAESVFALDMQIGKNVSYGNAVGEAWQYFGQPTPGAQNTTNGVDEIASAGLFDIGGVYINEVSSAAQPKSGELDWIEIRNGGDSDIN
ncbi:MAG: lamin tail domain-containing protein, partial [Clostridia bacterium]|nr:lamin tail domain-containing protein [Clostridia bacterium]